MSKTFILAVLVAVSFGGAILTSTEPAAADTKPTPPAKTPPPTQSPKEPATLDYGRIVFEN